MTIEPVSLEPREVSASAGESEASQRLEALNRAAVARRSRLRWTLPLLAIGVGISIFAALVATRDRPVTRDLPVSSPLVRVMTATPEDLLLTVLARGTVAPRTESDIVAEVRGRVVWLSPDLVVGGIFDAGDPLLRLDDREFRIARDLARANVLLRESEARLAASEADRRRQLEQRGAASASDLDQFENRELVASASLAVARAALDQSELDYERTVVRAPFQGRVRERSVDVGRFVTPGTKLGRIFAVDYAEVRLPIQTDDLAFLDFELDGSGMGGVEGARVVLTGRLGGREFVWPARLDRVEAAIDDQTRMLHVVARVDDPYALGGVEPAGDTTAAGALVAAGQASAREGARVPGGASEPDSSRGPRVPLPSGLFVTAEIEGREVSDVFVLPLMALRDGNRIFVAEAVDPPSTDGPPALDGLPALDVPRALDGPDATEGPPRRIGLEGRLSVREVSIVRRDRDRVVIDGGLEAGEQVVISPLRIHSEGMLLRLVEANDS
jgi:RND family efflux transporter MFP subunit